jgi:hypothetical protein
LLRFPCAARRRKQRKVNPVPEGISRPPCHWGTYMQRLSPPGWGLDARLRTSLCKKKALLLWNPKKWRPDALIEKSNRIFKGRQWLKKGYFANDNDDILMMMMMMTLLGCKTLIWNIFWYGKYLRTYNEQYFLTLCSFPTTGLYLTMTKYKCQWSMQNRKEWTWNALQCSLRFTHPFMICDRGNWPTNSMPFPPLHTDYQAL